MNDFSHFNAARYIHPAGELPGVPPVQRVELEGWFTLRQGKVVDGVKQAPHATLSFPNLITNNGLDLIGQSGSYTAYCHVGTDTTPEAVGDTALGAFVAAQAASADVSETYKSVQGGAPYYSTKHAKYEFGEGVAAGNLSEIGISTQATTGDLFSRALIKDGASPLGTTTITVLSDEYLDVFYELRMYPDHVGSPHGSGSIPIDTASPQTMGTYEIAAAYVTTYDYMSGVGSKAGYKAVASGYGICYGPASSLGAVTGAPTGTAASITTGGGSSVVNATYSPGSYYVDITWTVGLSVNVGGSPQGFEAVMFYTTMGSYQIKFGDFVAKDSTKIWSFTLRLAWARKTV